MPIFRPIAPDEIKRGLLAGLQDFIDPGDRLSGDLALGQQAVQVFTLGLQEISGSAAPANAHSAGWIFLAGTAGGEAVQAQTTEPAPGQPSRVASLSRAPEVAALIGALHQVEMLPQVQASPYQLSLLRIPGILVEAFWLKSLAAAYPDLVVPFHTLAKELQTMRPYSVADFAAATQPMAASFQEFDRLY